jgi:hypothetical protein
MNSEWGCVKMRWWQSKLLRPSWEASSRSVNGEFLTNYQTGKGQPVVPILCHIKPAYSLILDSWLILILSPEHGQVFNVVFCLQSFRRSIFQPSNPSYMTHPHQFPSRWFECPNNRVYLTNNTKYEPLHYVMFLEACFFYPLFPRS